jgi:hypothetical protein
LSCKNKELFLTTTTIPTSNVNPDSGPSGLCKLRCGSNFLIGCEDDKGPTQSSQRCKCVAKDFLGIMTTTGLFEMDSKMICNNLNRLPFDDPIIDPWINPTPPTPQPPTPTPNANTNYILISNNNLRNNNLPSYLCMQNDNSIILRSTYDDNCYWSTISDSDSQGFGVFIYQNKSTNKFLSIGSNNVLVGTSIKDNNCFWKIYLGLEGYLQHYTNKYVIGVAQQPNLQINTDNTCNSSPKPDQCIWKFSNPNPTPTPTDGCNIQ